MRTYEILYKKSDLDTNVKRILKDGCAESKYFNKCMPKLPFEFLTPDNQEEQSFTASMTVKTERV